MRLVFLTFGLFGLSACGSTWGERTPVATFRNLDFYFVDSDGDGWGDPDIEPIERKEPDGQYTARNGRDCDDTDPTMGGLVGSVCPGQMVASDTELEVLPLISENSEIVVIYGDDSPIVRYTAAESACQAWGQYTEQVEGSGEFVSQGRLLTLQSTTQWAELRDQLDSNVIVDGAFAAFIGLELKNTGDLETTEWGWTDDDGTAVDPFTFLPFCPMFDYIPVQGDDDPVCPYQFENPPSVEDFWPFIVSAEQASDTMPTEIQRVRLALIHDPTSSEQWCLGFPFMANGTCDEPPEGAVGPERYSFRSGHFICERPVANATDPRYIDSGAGYGTDDGS